MASQANGACFHPILWSSRVKAFLKPNDASGKPCLWGRRQGNATSGHSFSRIISLSSRDSHSRRLYEFLHCSSCGLRSLSLTTLLCLSSTTSASSSRPPSPALQRLYLQLQAGRAPYLFRAAPPRRGSNSEKRRKRGEICLSEFFPSSSSFAFDARKTGIATKWKLRP